jgi:hypothetical protein
MFKYFLTILLFTACFPGTAHAQNAGAVDDTDRPVKESKSSIRGRVIYEDNGKPVKRGVVALLSSENLATVEGSKTITDKDGRFIIREVPKGTYYPMVDVAGILNPTNYAGFAASGWRAEKASGRKLDGFFNKINVDGVNESELVILAKRAGAITGRVTYFDGDPAIGMRVEALRKSGTFYEASSTNLNTFLPTDSSTNVGTTVTDDRGVYRFSGLPPGKYVVYVKENVEHSLNGDSRTSTRDKRSELKTYYPGVDRSEDAGDLGIVFGLQQEGVDITISDRRLFTVGGIVVSKTDRRPLPTIAVSFRRIGTGENVSGGYISTQLYTGADGRWAFKDMPPGKYRFEFDPPSSSASDDPAEKKPARLGPTIREITLEDAPMDGIIVEMPAESGISGTITMEGGKPLQRETIYIFSQEKTTEAWGMASATPMEGSKSADFRIEKAVAGENNLLFSVNEKMVFVKSAKLGSIDLLAAPFILKEGEELKGVEVVLSDKTGQLKGKLTGMDDLPEMARIIVFPVDSTESMMQTRACAADIDDNGDFECKLAPGDYLVTFLKIGKSDEPWADWYDRNAEGATKVSIVEGETTKVTLQVPKE